MKSRLKNIIDYRSVEVNWNVDLSCPQEQVDKALRQVVRPFKKNIPVETLEKGDVVFLKLESDLAKFNKPMIPVTVGSGLFDMELEDLLAGHACGETFTAALSAGSVEVTVLKANRSVYPEPTDEMVAAYTPSNDSYEGITTVESFVAKVKENYAEEKRRDSVYEIMQEITDYIFTHEPTDIYFAEEDIAPLLEEYRQEAENEVKNDLKKDEVSMEEILTCLKMDSEEAMIHEMRTSCEWSIASALWVAQNLGLDPEELALDDDRLYNYSFLEEFVRENIRYVS